MPEPTITDKLDAVRRLLREGRTTEADRDLDTLEKYIHDEEERRKMEIPPPGPKTLAQLEHQFKVTVTDLLGNPPRLLALLVEIEGKSKEEE
jgi:hypothetical protein